MNDGVGQRLDRARPRVLVPEDLGDPRRALGQQQHLVGQVDRLLEVVRHQHHRRAGGHEHLLQLLADEERHLEVERRERLVQEQHLGLGRQRAHDRRRLLLPARQLVRIPVQVEPDVERRDQLGDAPVDLGLRLALELQRIRDVVDRAHPREHRLAVVLEHVADLGLGERLAVEQDLAGVDRDQAGDHVDERRLAAAVGPEHRHDPVLGDVEVEVLVQRPAGEVLGEAADRDVGARRARARTAARGCRARPAN